MRVTASLGLTKTSWCPRHGIQLYEGIIASLHGYTCNSGASVTPLLFLPALKTVIGEEEEESAAAQPVSSSRAQKQVRYLNLLIFIPLWEPNRFQTKKNRFQRWQTKPRSNWRAASQAETPLDHPEPGSKNARWSPTKRRYCVLSPGKLL